MFSMKAKYGIKAVLFLARKKERHPTLIADLAKREKIPHKFLEAILLELKNRGLLNSRKGKGGGYVLNRDPATIGLGQIIEIFDGPLATPSCVRQKVMRHCTECDERHACGLRWVLTDMRNALGCVMNRMTVADLIEKIRRENLDSEDGGIYI